MSSTNDDHGLGHCRYNTTEYYARVAPSAPWLQETMTDALSAPADAFPEVQFLADASYPDTPAGRAASAFFAIIDSDDPEVRRVFEQTWRAESALAQSSVEQRVDRWPSVRERIGEQTPVAFVNISPVELEVVSRNASGDFWRTFLFRCEEKQPRKLLAIEIMQSPPLHP